MIDRERFEQLAALSAADEASPEERTELAAMVAEEPGLAAEIAAQESADRMIRRAALGEETPMPRAVLEMLEQTRREALSARLAAEAAQAGGANVAAFQPAARAKRSLVGWLALAACLAILATLTTLWIRPGGGMTQPVFGWNNDGDPNVRYDAWVLPAAGNAEDAKSLALFVAKNVRAPLSLTEMKPGGGAKGDILPALERGKEYRLLVCLATVGPAGGDAIPFKAAAKVEVPAPDASVVLRRLLDSHRQQEARAMFDRLPESLKRSPAIQLLLPRIDLKRQ